MRVAPSDARPLERSSSTHPSTLRHSMDNPVIRTPLLTAMLDSAQTVDHVEVVQIALGVNQQAGLHLHPCPVVGVVISGSILFQLEGQTAHLLHAGDAFFEPAHARVSHFDAQDQGATFIAQYLLGPGEHELITMLQ